MLQEELFIFYHLLFLQVVADCLPSREWHINSQGSAKSGDVAQVQELCCVTVLQAKAQQGSLTSAV